MPKPDPDPEVIHPTPERCGEVRRDWEPRRPLSGRLEQHHDYVADDRDALRREAVATAVAILAVSAAVVLVLWSCTA